MTFEDICTCRKYTKDGEEKVFWNKVGTLKITDEGKKFIELGMYPETSFYVFKQKAKEEKDSGL